jgi:hypothetical protein
VTAIFPSSIRPRAEGKHLPCALIQQLLRRDVPFRDDLEGAVGIDHEVFLVASGDVARYNTPFRMT